MKTGYLQKLQEKSMGLLSYIQLLFYSGIQLLRNINLFEKFFLSYTGQYLFNHFIVLFSLADIVFKLKKLVKAKNKNWVVAGNFIISVVSGVLFGVAALGSLFAPVLFNPLMLAVTAGYIGFLTLQSLFFTAFNFYKYKTTQDPHLKAVYLQNFKSNLTSLVGYAFACVMLGLTVAFAGTPVGWACGVVLAAATVAFVAVKFLMWAIPKIKAALTKSSEQEESVKDELSVEPTSSLDSVMKKIQVKKQQIHLEIQQEAGTFFGDIQKEKRENKLELLNALETSLESDANLLPSAHKNGVFQSFFKRAGDVELIYDEVRELKCRRRPAA